MPTTQPAVIDLLLAGIQQVCTAVDPTAALPDGWPGPTQAKTIVTIGGTSAPTAEGAQDWAYLGALSREELYDVVLIVSVTIGGDGLRSLVAGADAQKAARDLAYLQMAAIETWLVDRCAPGGGPTLGQFFNTGTRKGGWCGLKHQALQETDGVNAAQGASAEFHVTVCVYAII